MMTLTGTCNRCGQCCTAEHEGVTVACEYLRRWPWASLGSTEATFCAMYERRYDGMPITMRNREETVELTATCRKNSPEETAVIIARGIGKGCSLTLVTA